MAHIQEKKMVMRIFYIGLALSTISLFVQAQHAGEKFSIGIYDVDNAIRTGLDQLGGASLISDDKSVIILKTRSFETFSGSHGRLPEMIEFMWRPEAEKFPHLDKMMVRSQIPPGCLRILRSTAANHLLSLVFFVQHGVPQFSWELEEVGLAYGVRESPEVESCRGIAYSSPIVLPKLR